MRKRIVDVAYAFFFQHLWLLTGLCLLVTLVGVLWACAHNGHLPAEFPSPSDTGSFQPESAFFTFGLFWAMIGLAATFGRHALVFGTFLADQRKQHRATHFSTTTSTSGKPGWLGVVTALLLSERDDLKLLKMGTIIGIAGACFGTMVAAFDVRKHVVLHTIGAACLFIFTNLYYSILLRINHLVLERHALIHDAARLREDDMRLSTGNMNNRSLTDSTIISLSSSSSSPPPISLVSSSVVDTTTTLSSSSSSSSSTATMSSSSSSIPSSGREAKHHHHGGHLGFKAVVGRDQGVSNLTWLRVLSVMGCWFCLFGIIGFRLQFVSEGGHQSWDKERVAFLIFWANLFEWLWLGLVLVYGFIVFYWDYYHSPLSSPYFGFSPSSSGAAAPLVFRIRCEVQRPDDVHLV